jgi:hypothetical protein
MTAHIDYPTTYKREREEVVKKNKHDSSKPPVSEGGKQ